MTTFKKLAVFVAITALFTWNLQAQSKNEAIEAYNQGAGLVNTDVKGAIGAFEKSIAISEQVGDSAADIREKSIAILPSLYYKIAYKYYTDKNISAAISASKKTIDVSDKYNNDKTKGSAITLLTQAYMTQGAAYFKTNEYDKAISAFDSALIVSPDYYKALLPKAQAYVKTNNDEMFGQTIDQFIEKAADDANQVAAGKKLALDFYRLAGSKANSAKKYDEAIASLNLATKYGEDKDVYYQLAKANNEKKNFTEAAELAQKGLNLETGAAEAKAKYYYELGVAQVGKGDKDSACASFKNAQFGPFVTAAKGQQTNLKCPGAAPAPAK